MDAVRIIEVNQQKIIYIDYSNLKEKRMIELLGMAKAFILEANGPVLLLSNFHNTYVTPAFMREAEKEVASVNNRIAKSAFIGMSTPKKMILQGFNLFLKRDYRAFETEKEAIDFLVSETTNDK